MRNVEGLAAYDGKPDHQDRHPGLAGLVRLKNEEVWCKLALESFVDWCDELIVIVNASTDATPIIVEEFRQKHPSKVFVSQYPFEIHPMGPGHDKCLENSVHASAYMHNYAQAMSSTTHVVKLDGDMVMMDWAGERIRDLMEDGHDRIKFSGTDIVGDDLRHLGCHPLCRTNGVYRVRPGVRYTQGHVTQNLKNAGDPTAAFSETFLHFKWARKSLDAATVQWPENWREVAHFQNIFQRRIPVKVYTGEYPTSIKALL